MIANVDGKILTLDSGDRYWLASVDKVKLYRHHSQDINLSHNKIYDLNGNHDYLRGGDSIFGSLVIASNSSNSISVEE